MGKAMDGVVRRRKRDPLHDGYMRLRSLQVRLVLGQSPRDVRPRRRRRVGERSRRPRRRRSVRGAQGRRVAARHRRVAPNTNRRRRGCRALWRRSASIHQRLEPRALWLDVPLSPLQIGGTTGAVVWLRRADRGTRPDSTSNSRPPRRCHRTCDARTRRSCTLRPHLAARAGVCG